ncbi:MAG: hypothetical protein HY763_05080 [Planctomycetes bacterium]|nr:hypothetical protein [Planctomycetota bacterium]
MLPAIVSLISAFTSLGGASPTDSFFYVLEPPDRKDRVYRIDWNGTVTPIGAEGALGWSSVRQLVWDWEHGRLYGFDDQFDVWLEINPTSGAGTALGAFTIEPTFLTYSPDDDMVYASNQFSIHRIDPRTGSHSQIANFSSFGLAYIRATTGGLTGLATLEYTGLTIVRLPDLMPFRIGGGLVYPTALFWDPSNDILYQFNASDNNTFYTINQVTGARTTTGSWNFGFNPLTVSSIAFVPAGGEPTLDCRPFDTDGDDDLDLADWAIMQDCFGGPGR